jgi:hypothetical protein
MGGMAQAVHKLCLQHRRNDCRNLRQYNKSVTRFNSKIYSVKQKKQIIKASGMHNNPLIIHRQTAQNNLIKAD